MIVPQVGSQDPVQMGFAQYDHVVQALPTYRADNSFAVRVLPRRACCNRDFFNSHVSHAVLEVVAVDAVAVANEKTRCFLVRESVDSLLGRPLGMRIVRHVEVGNRPSVVTQNDEDVRDAKSGRWDREEVARRDVRNVVVQEDPPCLGRRLLPADQVLGYGSFGHIVAQEGQFGYDPGRAPGRILA